MMDIFPERRFPERDRIFRQVSCEYIITVWMVAVQDDGIPERTGMDQVAGLCIDGDDGLPDIGGLSFRSLFLCGLPALFLIGIHAVSISGCIGSRSLLCGSFLRGFSCHRNLLLQHFLHCLFYHDMLTSFLSVSVLC